MNDSSMNGSKKETYEVTRNKRTRLYVRTILNYSSYTEQEPSSGTMVSLDVEMRIGNAAYR